MSLYGSNLEYGLHCLAYLVDPPADQAISARNLAEFQGVSPTLVAKLFTKLKAAGIVEAEEGVRGGYRLARPASDISVLDVIDALEGDKPLFDCKQINGNCAVLDDTQAQRVARGMCMIHAVMLEAEQAMRAKLRTYSLTDISRGLASSMPPRFMQNMEAWFLDRLNRRNKALPGDGAATNKSFVPSSSLYKPRLEQSRDDTRD